MNRRKILEILFWIFLIVGIILILWKVFGKSPTDLSIIITFILMLMFKMWAMSDETKEFKHEVRISFNKVKNDFNNIESFEKPSENLQNSLRRTLKEGKNKGYSKSSIKNKLKIK